MSIRSKASLALVLLLCASLAHADGITNPGSSGSGSPNVSNATGTLPVANGGTGDTGAAWASYSPTAVCGQSTGTTVCTATGAFKTIGKTVFVQFSNVVSGTFTAGTFSSFSLPTTAANNALHSVLTCREAAATGLGWFADISPNASGAVMGVNSSNSQTVVATYNINCSGVYQSQ